MEVLSLVLEKMPFLLQNEDGVEDKARSWLFFEVM